VERDCVFMVDKHQLREFNPELQPWKSFGVNSKREEKGAQAEKIVELILNLFRLEWKSTAGFTLDKEGVDHLLRVFLNCIWVWIGEQVKSSPEGIQHFVKKNPQFANSLLVISIDINNSNSFLSAICYYHELFKELKVELKWDIKSLFVRLYKLTNGGKNSIRLSYKNAIREMSITGSTQSGEEIVQLLLTLGIAKRVEGGDIKIEIKHKGFLSLISSLK